MLYRILDMIQIVLKRLRALAPGKLSMPEFTARLGSDPHSLGTVLYGRCDLNKYDFRIFLTAFSTSVLGVLIGWAFMDGGLRRLTKATTRFPLDYVRISVTRCFLVMGIG